MNDDEDDLVANSRKLLDPSTKAGRLRKAAYELLLQHMDRGEIPTNGRFLFYELEQLGHVPKKYEGVNPTTGKDYRRSPAQDITDATMDLRKAALIPWWWLDDESRDVIEPSFAATVLDDLIERAPASRINAWDRWEPPLIICESRAVKGVLEDLAYEYLTPLTATGGQSGGFIVNGIVPLLQDSRNVLYIGDYELRGPAEQIEANTRRYIENHAGRGFDAGSWTRIALTQQQVRADERLQRLAIEKLDRRYKPAKSYEAVECEALGQGEIVRMVRERLDQERRMYDLDPIEDVRIREEQERQQAVRRLGRLRRSP
jgi:hypothetical protein